jgi:uncharacterized membrane protein
VTNLIAIAYPDEAAVMRARGRLEEASKANLVEVEDVLVLVRDEKGRIDLRRGSSGVGAAAAGGAMWGGLIGLVLLVPLLGMAAGAAAGAGAWKRAVGEAGIDESFVTELRDSLTPGTAALVVLVRDWKPAKVLPLIQEQGQLIQTSLDDRLASQLEASLRAATPGTG